MRGAGLLKSLAEVETGEGVEKDLQVMVGGNSSQVKVKMHGKGLQVQVRLEGEGVHCAVQVKEADKAEPQKAVLLVEKEMAGMQAVQDTQVQDLLPMQLLDLLHLQVAQNTQVQSW